MRIIETADVVVYEHANEMLARYRETKKKFWAPPQEPSQPQPKLAPPDPEPESEPPPPPPPPPPPQYVSIQIPISAATNILKAVCTHYGVEKTRLLSPTRNKGIVRMRWIAMYLLKRRMNYSLMEIGRRMKLDHTTVLHGLRGMAKLLENGCPETAAAIAAVESLMDVDDAK